jgi:Methyltransferase FkbM domain
VIVKTVDEATPSIDVSSNVLLKIDTQGFEWPVLQGAKETLKKVRGVLLELPITKLYKDNWSFGEAVAYMEGSGFVLAQVHPVNIHSKAKDSAAEFDCLFRPPDPSID